MIDLCEQELLTIPQAAVYFNIGRNKLYELTCMDDCQFLVMKFGKRYIIRTKFENYIMCRNAI